MSSSNNTYVVEDPAVRGNKAPAVYVEPVDSETRYLDVSATTTPPRVYDKQHADNPTSKPVPTRT